MHCSRRSSFMFEKLLNEPQVYPDRQANFSQNKSEIPSETKNTSSIIDFSMTNKKINDCIAMVKLNKAEKKEMKMTPSKLNILTN